MCIWINIEKDHKKTLFYWGASEQNTIFNLILFLQMQKKKYRTISQDMAVDV